MTDPRADLSRERAERTEREQAELANGTSARLNNALMNICVGFLLGGIVGILFASLFFRWGWWGVLGGGLAWLVVSASVMAYAMANASEIK